MMGCNVLNCYTRLKIVRKFRGGVYTYIVYIVIIHNTMSSVTQKHNYCNEDEKSCLFVSLYIQIKSRTEPRF